VVPGLRAIFSGADDGDPAMIRLALAALLALALPAAAQTRSITDSAGRVVTLPDRVETVFAAGAPAAILLHALAPDRMLGWPRANRPDEREFLAQPMPTCRNWAP
jgi:iron complex transport system substrate-binding protein